MNNLAKVQQWLKKNNIDVFILVRSDEFLNEYIAPYAERLNWVSNFSGSAGKTVIMQSTAFIFVDGRYTVQANEEVNLNDFSIEHLNDFSNWLKNNLRNKYTIGLDPNLHSIKDLKSIKKIIKDMKAEIKILDNNPIDQLWKNQPPRPVTRAFQHDVKYTGRSVENKIAQIQFLLTM